jgi:hypothetical protein
MGGLCVVKLPAEAYEALSDALAKVFWHKRAFERYLRLALRDYPELLAGLPFSETKREVCDLLIARLSAKENSHRAFTLALMLEVSDLTDFPDVRSVKDRPELLPAAELAVARLRRIVKPLAKQSAESEAILANAKAQRATAQANQDAARHLLELKQEFLDLGQMSNPQQRGRDFERLLVRLFDAYDLEPRIAYIVDADQIDGSLTFDSDDYILEAKWTARPVERETADSLWAKISRSGKNGLGLFVSVGGFSSGFKNTYGRSTPFITMDGVDLITVLDGRFRLDDLLRAKKRHANETGSCFLPVSELTS